MGGDDSDRETPLPIPNRVVKTVCADGSANWWESRRLPRKRLNTKF